MTINVQFGKNGFYHPAYGRLGRGGNKNAIYQLPDEFAKTVTREVPIMDHTSKPPRQVGEKEITRYQHLPSSATILDEDDIHELTEEALDAGEEPPKPKRPKVVEPTQLESVTGRGQTAKPQGAIERTTGEKPKAPTTRRSRRKVAPD